MASLILAAAMLTGATVYDQSNMWPFAGDLDEFIVYPEFTASLILEADGLTVDRVGSWPFKIHDVSGSVIQHGLLDFEYQNLVFRRDITGHNVAYTHGEAWCPLTNRFEEFFITMDVTGHIELTLDNVTRKFKPIRPGSNYVSMIEGSMPSVTSNTITIDWMIQGPISSVSGSFDWQPLAGTAAYVSFQAPITDETWVEHATMAFHRFAEPVWRGTVDGADFTLKREANFGTSLRTVPVYVATPEPGGMAIMLIGLAIVVRKRPSRIAQDR